jgi:heme/copper-type cytochrome/quinol oxidase subunit 3
VGVAFVPAIVRKEAHSLKALPAVHGLTLLGGAIFLVVKTIEYSDKFSHHLYPATNNFLGLYFTLTGLHAVHVIVGMIVNAYLWGQARGCGAASPSASRTASRLPASIGTSWTWCGSSSSPFCTCS